MIVQAIVLVAILSVLFIYLLKKVILPYLICTVVDKVSFDKELLIDSVHIKSVTDDGLQLSLSFRIPLRAFFFNIGIVSVQFTSPIRIIDTVKNNQWAVVLIDTPITLGGRFGSSATHWQVDLDPVDVLIADSIDMLKPIVRRVNMGGGKEIEGIIVRLEGCISIDFFGWLTVDHVALVKTVNVAKLQAARAIAIENQKAAKARLAVAENQKAAELISNHQSELVDSASLDQIQKPISSSLETPTQTLIDSQLDQSSISKHSTPALEDITAKPIKHNTVDSTSTPEVRVKQMELAQFITRNKNGIPTLNKTAIYKAVNEATNDALDQQGIRELFAIRHIHHHPVITHMRSINTGLNIQFDTIPSLTFKFSAIKFNVFFNGSKVANGVLRGVEMLDTRKDMQILLEIVPSVVSNTPIQGIATTAKGVLKGALKGAFNGFLFGDWGAEATVFSIAGIQVENEQGNTVPWISDLLSVMELEYDLDAVRKVGSSAMQATGTLKEVMLKMTAGVLEASGSIGSKCSLM
ncbi:hypothetical protein BDV3_004636 [Batrachochytrium dendrobatidis]|uniref:Uncharacterized protein n=1 Tax=Batrachochytrium dendrobatidis (strain JEL423) TaxID=403673 RepID=A0A177WGL2_BATDL|nr:hypothetical protein BDEG_23131 [Batrachochytrium dendrobatidis JEL423]